MFKYIVFSFENNIIDSFEKSGQPNQQELNPKLKPTEPEAIKANPS